MQDTPDKLIDNVSDGESFRSDNELSTISIEILDVESMMRHAHETLKTLLLLSGVSNPQGSSFSSHYSKRKENGKPEAYHIIRRSSSAADHPVNTGAGTESKSPMRKRRTKYPLRRLPGAPWSMSKTDRISNWLPTASCSGSTPPAREYLRGENYSVSSSGHFLATGLLDASAANPATSTPKSMPSFSIGRPIGRKRGTSPTGQEPKIATREVQPRQGGDVTTTSNAKGRDPSGECTANGGQERERSVAWKSPPRGVAEKETYGFHDPRPGSATDTPVGKIDDGDTVALKIGKGEDQIEAFATTTVREALGTRNGSESDACEGVDADEEHSCKDVEELTGTCCTKFCWFGCKCRCHTATPDPRALAVDKRNDIFDSDSAPEMKTTSGSGMRSAGETLRKVGTKRSELRQSEPGVGSNENLKVSEKRRDIRKVCSKEDRWTGRDRRPAYEGGPEGDVCRAFLATSECRGGPRPIRICAAARHLSTPIDSAQGEGAEAASAVTRDLSVGEAMIRPRVKSFFLSRRARDPELARAESKAKASLTVGKRVRNVIAHTNSDGAPGVSGHGGGVNCADAKAGTSNSTRRVDGDESRAQHPEANNTSTEATEDSPTLAVRRSKSDSCATSIVRKGVESVWASSASVSGSGRDVIGDKREKVMFVTAMTETTREAAKTNATASAAGPDASVCDTGSELKQLSEPYYADKKTIPAVGLCDTFLSHRPRVRSVVFPRPQTHQARQTTGKVGLPPGPGHYETGGVIGFCRSFTMKGASMVASKRSCSRAHKAKIANLRGPGEYNIARAEDITRVRRVSGIVTMRNVLHRGRQIRDWKQTNPTCRRSLTGKGKPHIHGNNVGRQWAPRHGRGRRGLDRPGSESRRGRRGVSVLPSLSLSRDEEKEVHMNTSLRRNRRSGRSSSLSRHRRSSFQQQEKKGRSYEPASRREFCPDERDYLLQECSKRDSHCARRTTRTRICYGRPSRPSSRPRGRQRESSLAGNMRRSSCSSRKSSLSSREFGGRRSRAQWPHSHSQNSACCRHPGHHPHPHPRPASWLSSARFDTKVSDIFLSPSDSSGLTRSGGCSTGRNRRDSYRRSSDSTTNRIGCGRSKYHSNASRNGRERGRRCTSRRRERRAVSSHRRWFSMCSNPNSASDTSYFSPESGRKRASECHSLVAKRYRRRRQRRRRRRVRYISQFQTTDHSSSSSSHSSSWRGNPISKSRRPGHIYRHSSNYDLCRKRRGRVDGGGQYLREEDSVWKSFLLISKRAPAWKFAPPEGKRARRKNRLAAERARLQRENKRGVGFHEVRHSLTEKRAICSANFEAQAQARSRERERILRKSRVLAMKGKEKARAAGCLREEYRGFQTDTHVAWASEGGSVEPKRGGTASGGRRVEDPTRRRPPVFRYTKKLPLPLSAARRQAEKEDVERRRDWLDVNVHKSWVDSDTAVVLDVGCRGEDARMVAFGTTRGREDVIVKKKGEMAVRPFNHGLRPTDSMGPGRYETEEIGRTTRTGRLSDARVPLMAQAVARDKLVGPRGERALAAVEWDQEATHGVEGDILMLDVKDYHTTRGRRVSGGVLPLAWRWTEHIGSGEDVPLGEEAFHTNLDSGKDQVGPRRDKGHRYLQFEKQAGRSATVESLPREEGGGFGLINFDAVEGDVLQLNPQEGWKGKGGTVVQMEKQVGRWVEDRRANCEQEDGDKYDGDILLLDPDHYAVRRRPILARAFDKQLGWREREEEGILERNDWLQSEEKFVPTRKPPKTRRKEESEESRERENLVKRGWHRPTMLVNMDRQRVTDEDGHELLRSPTMTYKDAQYDTARGIAFTKGRIGKGAVIMNRSQERWGRGGGNRDYSSDGDIGTREGEPLFKEADELMLSPRWSSNAVRSGYAIEWRRSAATIHFLEAHNEVDENGDFNGCKLEGVEAARARTSRWRSSTAKTLLNIDLSKAASRTYALDDKHP